MKIFSKKVTAMVIKTNKETGEVVESTTTAPLAHLTTWLKRANKEYTSYTFERGEI